MAEAGLEKAAVARSFPPCAGVSTPARRFMLESCSASWETIDLSAEGLAALRAETAGYAMPGCWEVVRECGSLVEDGEIAGVHVQHVYPRSIRGTERILYLFGGGFISGSPAEDLSITARLADLLGRHVIAPTYRLAPEHPFPAARDDALTVYRRLVAESSGGVVVVGESAGGNLAMTLVLFAAEQGLPPPLAVALLSPWVDMTHSGDSHMLAEGLDPGISVEHLLVPASRAYAGGASLSSPGISPLFAELPSAFPPTVITSATRDLLLSDCVRLAARLRKQGTTVDLQVTEGLFHVFEYKPELPEAAQSLRDVAAFLARHLSAQREATSIARLSCLQWLQPVLWRISS